MTSLIARRAETMLIGSKLAFNTSTMRFTDIRVTGASGGARTHRVSLKRRIHLHWCYRPKMVAGQGVEPTPRRNKWLRGLDSNQHRTRLTVVRTPLSRVR